MRICSSKLYGNDELHLPKKIKENYTYAEITEDTIFDWFIRDDEIILKPRIKISVEEILGIKKEE